MKEYKVKYDIVPGKFTKEELNGYGGADAVLVGSIIRAESGWTSTAWYSRDGETGEECTATEYFKAWALLAKKISEMPEALEWHRVLTESVFRSVQNLITGKREL